MELIEVHAFVIAALLLIHILGAVIRAASTAVLGFLILVVIRPADASKNHMGVGPIPTKVHQWTGKGIGAGRQG